MSHQQHELRSAVPIAGPSGAHHSAAGQADVHSSTPVTPGPASGSVTPGGQAHGQSHAHAGHSTLPAVPSDPALSASASRDQQAAAKQSLKQWWTKFTKQQQQAQQQQQQGGSSYGKKDDSMSGKGVFGVPMTASLKYAGVAISMVGPDGVNQVYGYIPIVVAKCGLFLKQKATTVEGVFRISGSTRRMKELQDIFDRPPSYGRDVVWGPWSVHDAASVLRRYLNQMPEPVVPYELYDEFRNALPPPDKAKDPAAINASILRYKALIACLPSSSKYLLRYVLDLLNVFARNHEFNLMPATNLSVVFQPGLIRPPDYEPIKTGIPIPGANADGSNDPMSPPTFPQLSRSSSNPLNNNPLTNSSTESTGTTTELQRRQDEIKINQEVLAFLINHQDHFVALPEPISSSEVSPVTPTNSSTLPPRPAQSQAQAASQQGGPVDGARSAKPSLPQGTVKYANANAAAGAVAVPSQPMQPKQATQPTQQAARPPRVPETESSKPYATASQPGPLPGSQPRANIQPIQSSMQAAPANRREIPQTTLSPGVPMSPSADPSLPAAAFPASSSAATKKSSKTKESDKDERKPRKLKKGRTPTSSGTSTPLSPPLQGQSGNVTSQHHDQHRPVIHTISDAPTPIYDEDTPLQAAGPGVKRSRTLPSPGADRTASPRSVGSRRQSESRASPQPLTPEARDRATPSPLRSPLPLPRTAPLSATSSRPSTARSQVFADSGVDQSEDSDTGAGAAERRGKGWRKAFRRDRDPEGPSGKDTSLRVPTSAGLQPSRSTQSSRSHDGSSARDVYAAGKEAVTLQQRRPSASSTARSDQGEGSGASQQPGQLRAVRNPPLQGAGSKRDGKKKADENAAISAEAIRDAVANIGRG